MKGRLQLLRAEVASDRHAFELQIEILRTLDLGCDDPDEGDVARAAVALHHAYGSVESLLHRVAKALEGEPFEGPEWHQALLHSMTLELDGIRPVVLSQEVAAELRRLLAFRHFFRHAYAAAFDARQLDELTRVATGVAGLLNRDLDALDEFLRATAESED